MPLIHVLLYLVAVALAVGLVHYCVDAFQLADPLGKMIKVVAVVVGVVIVILLVLGLVGVISPIVVT